MSLRPNQNTYKARSIPKPEPCTPDDPLRPTDSRFLIYRRNQQKPCQWPHLDISINHLLLDLLVVHQGEPFLQSCRAECLRDKVPRLRLGLRRHDPTTLKSKATVESS